MNQGSLPNSAPNRDTRLPARAAPRIASRDGGRSAAGARLYAGIAGQALRREDDAFDQAENRLYTIKGDPRRHPRLALAPQCLLSGNAESAKEKWALPWLI